MSMINKIAVCLCCNQVACSTACCIDEWHSYEACGIAYIECGNCCWTVCAPICHSCSIGDFGTGGAHCVTGVKYCLYACGLSLCAPVDGIYNCIMYIASVCKDGATGYGDILKNTKWMANIIRNAMEFPEPPQPVAKLSEYRP